ncbi:hypothetical protein AABD46_05645 [Vibrio parahaemolyticus]|uniref:hypothetical protein n=1 Tax=Vibrio TaxID=662 RepID=UPI00132F0958|nr:MULTISPECIES: hypothetical protein [Vibrio]MBE3698488.1 hypothetical protein [Vibrio parahaemolyticus]MBE3777937.1 hypothetical protein [Vibrio parahaemolyticus]MCZ6246282.1 hypothetical protein [Vibrio parahaemolyticus]MDE0551212.1 hypothetical protein [Vibrio sp. VP6]QHG93789.1 hypothetical protein EHC70_06015 [Vibrio parahaemolyticus]
MKSQINMNTENNDLYTKVKAGFLLKGTSLHRWCIDNEVKRQAAALALKGIWNGPKSSELKRKIIEAAGLSLIENE